MLCCLPKNYFIDDESAYSPGITSARPISSQVNTGRITFSLHATLTPTPLFKRGSSRGRYSNVYVGLTEKQAEKLSKASKVAKKTESAVLRGVIAEYLKKPVRLKKQSCRKQKIIGLKRLPRTIYREQDIKLREIAKKTGRTISEVVREVVEEY